METYIEKGLHPETMQRKGIEVHHSKDAYADYASQMKAMHQPIGLHHHAFYEIFFFLSGDIDYLIESRLYHLRPGDLLLINPSEMHQPVFVPAQGFYERIVLWLEPSLLKELSRTEDLSLCFTKENLIRLEPKEKETLLFYFAQLVKETHKKHAPVNEGEKALVTLILSEINEASLHPESLHAYTEDYLSPYTDKAVQYIAAHLNGPLSVRTIASYCAVSSQYLTKLFRKDLGITLHQYILQKRILSAQQYMASGMNATEAARQCGFENYSTFWREYGKEYGLSPSQYTSSRVK